MPDSDIPENTIFIGEQCNSNCIMCPYTEHFRRNSRLESLDSLKSCVDEISSFAEYVCITGGEPTMLREDFLKLIDYCKNYFSSVLLHVLTNGRTFAYKDFLADFRKVRPYKTLLGIPIHADKPELHDYISQSSGSFRETLQGLDNLYTAREQIIRSA